MKKLFLLLFCGFCILQTMAQTKPYWQDVQVVAVNKEYPRSSFMTYDNLEQALSFKYENSKFYSLLNGTWKFYFVDGYKKLPANITDPSLSTADWKDIQVPGNWEPRVTEWLSTPTTVMNSSPAIRNHRLFRKKIRSVFTAGTSIYRQSGWTGIFT